eukprot:6958553-Ditylum_brightwellii.AAC.1
MPWLQLLFEYRRCQILKYLGIPFQCQKDHHFALKKESKTAIELRKDLEGSISRGAEFTSMIIDEFPGIKISTTSGCASWLNGKFERPHETIKNRTQSTLMDAGREEKY